MTVVSAKTRGSDRLRRADVSVVVAARGAVVGVDTFFVVFVSDVATVLADRTRVLGVVGGVGTTVRSRDAATRLLETVGLAEGVCKAWSVATGVGFRCHG